MPDNKPQRLSEIVEQYAPQGANDARWFFVEHQLAQIKFSGEAIERKLREIMGWPENDKEGNLAADCHYLIRQMGTDFLGRYATYRSLLSGTDVPERISRKEL